MNEVKNVTQCIARIWRMYKKQEALFRSAMGLNTSSTLRKICSTGYMMSLLFKKDVDSMYESVKNNLDDGELASITRTDDSLLDSIGEYELLLKISEQQEMLLGEYKALLSKLDKDSEAARACDEHIEKLAGLENSLARELGTHPASKLKSYSSVA
nr:hypothetical protein [uncultured Dyadobacter sp.]